MVKKLLAAHANPNAGRANLPLQYAASTGDIGLLELLLSNGANPNTNIFVNGPVVLGNGDNYPQGGTFSPLLLAISGKHPEAVSLLIRFKADPNALMTPGGTPLLFRALSSDLDTLKALLEGGANANARDSSGVSGLVHFMGTLDANSGLLAEGSDSKVQFDQNVTLSGTMAASGSWPPGRKRSSTFPGATANP